MKIAIAAIAEMPVITIKGMVTSFVMPIIAPNIIGAKVAIILPIPSANPNAFPLLQLLI